MERIRPLSYISLGGFATLLVLTIFQDGKHTVIMSFALLLFAMLPFFLRFERKKTDSRMVVFISLIAAIAAVARVPFAAVPSVQPTSFIIIVTGLVFGAETGFMAGAMAAFVSNFFLMQGPWTPWQMFSWGMMGLTAGLLKDSVVLRSLAGKLVFGFAWGFLFGWIMNIWTLTYLMLDKFNLNMLLASFALSFYHDLLHALSNVFFIALFCKNWMKILYRFKKKVPN